MTEKRKSFQEKKNILITGPPGIGKTTLIKILSQILPHSHIAGFYTEEIREKGVRKGFALISFSGRKSILSHVDIRSRYRVGKYGVDVSNFEEFLDGIDFLKPETDLIIIDEIGKMECYSTKFKRLTEQLLDSGKPVIATISMKGGGIIEEIKNRSYVKLFVMTQNNRDELLSEILKVGGNWIDPRSRLV
ncbi:MAG: NTPase [Syntrophaceae bacterium]